MLSGQDEGGQTLIIFIMALTVMMVVGAIAVDVGLWLSERRGSQTDADFSALSGAWELLDPGATEDDARDAASYALTGNDEAGNASFISLPEVDLASRCVTVNVRHDSRALFFQYFGILDEPDIGAHAVACAGAAQAPGNLLPFQISDNPGPCFDNDEQPIFTALCPIEGGAHEANPRGIVDVEASEDYCSEASGSGDIEDTIINGAQGICLINETGFCDPATKGGWYDCVAVQTGNPKKVLDGVNARVSQDGLCDANFGDGDGIDEFDETVDMVIDTGDPYTSIYAPIDCDPGTEGDQLSPRLVTIFVLEEDPPTNAGNTGFPVIAFAGIYLAGCAHEDDTVVDESDLDPYCGDQIVRRASPQEDLYVSAALPGPAAAPAPAALACPGSRKSLIVIKDVVGGSADPSDFTITVVSDGNPVPATFPGASSPGTEVCLDAGSTYAVTETGPVGYVPTLSSGCSGNIGGGKTCTITNTYAVPTATPTPTPSASPTASPSPGGSPTPSPTPEPAGDCPPGHCTVYGRFVNLVFSGGDIGEPTDQTTLFGIALVE